MFRAVEARFVRRRCMRPRPINKAVKTVGQTTTTGISVSRLSLGSGERSRETYE